MSDFNSMEGNSEYNSVKCNSDSNSNDGNSNSIPIPPGLGQANSIPIPEFKEECLHYSTGSLPVTQGSRGSLKSLKLVCPFLRP